MAKSIIGETEMHSVANLSTLLLDLATFQTPLATFFSKEAPSDKIKRVLGQTFFLFPRLAGTAARAQSLVRLIVS